MHLDSTHSERPRHRHRHHRRRRRSHSYDARQVFETLSNNGSSAAERARAWAALFDETLKVVERTAWDVRALADQARATARTRAPQEPSEGTSGLRRFASTAWMLVQLAVSYRAHGFRSAFVSRDFAAAELERLHETNARRFFETSVRHGGAFLKVGQLLSARKDVLPAAWIAELSKLQDEVPPVPFDVARVAIEVELGPIADRFESFDESPIAAASIGQVYEAVTTEGQRVAVKVKRPGIEALIDADTKLLALFMQSMRSMLPPLDYDSIETEVRSILAMETEYVQEAEALARAADYFSRHPHIVVPQPVASHSGHSVMTSVFVDGTKITDVLDDLCQRRDDGDDRAGARVNHILTSLLEAYVRMVLDAGIFQADPHPGNLLVTDDDRIVVLDFGASKTLPADVRSRYLSVVCAFISGNRDRLVEVLVALGFRTASGKPDTLLAFAEALLHEMRDALAGNTNFEWPNKEQLLQRAAALLKQAEADPVVKIPSEFVMIGRVFGTLGGLFMHYRPRIDYTRALLPVIGRAMAEDALTSYANS